MLARKISRAKWADRPSLVGGRVQADALVDLRTSSNKLSVWRCESNDPGHVDRAFLALAANADKVEGFDVVCLSEQDMRDRGIESKDEAGATPVLSLQRYHVDLVDLDMQQLCCVATAVKQATSASDAIHERTKGQVTKLLADAVLRGELQVNVLKEPLRRAVATKLLDEVESARKQSPTDIDAISARLAIVRQVIQFVEAMKAIKPKDDTLERRYEALK